jgi:hypothetical protein
MTAAQGMSAVVSAAVLQADGAGIKRCDDLLGYIARWL